MNLPAIILVVGLAASTNPMACGISRTWLPGVPPEASSLVVFGEIVERLDEVDRPWARMRILYRWQGTEVDTVSFRISSADDPGFEIGAAYLVLAPALPFAEAAAAGIDLPPWPAFEARSGGTWEEEACVPPFYQLGTPDWIRPGQAWLDLTPGDLLTIGRAQPDVDLIYRGLGDLRNGLEPADYAERLRDEWYTGPMDVRLAMARLVAADRYDFTDEGRALLHRMALDGCGSDEAGTRCAGAWLLGALGVGSTTTLAVLERLEGTDPDREVRSRARTSLEELQGQR